MATDPDDDLVAHIAANVASLTADVNLFASAWRPAEGGIPVECVFVLLSGGVMAEAFIDAGAFGVEERKPQLQISVRSKRDEYRSGKLLANSIRDAVHHATIAGYLDVTVLEDKPIYIETTDDLSHRWSINVMMEHRE